jgi:titin
VTGANDSRVQGNFIGTDYTGTKALPGQWEGVMVQGESNLIGGATPGTGNVISGNVIGVDLRAPGNSVQGNLIGPDLTGTIALGNGCGIYLADSAANNTIGGTTPGTGNVISGNTLPGGYWGGIFMQGPGVTGNRVQGNLIGTDLTGTQPLGNTEGIVIFRSSNNTIGGAEPSAGNVIAHSGMAGVWVAGDEALGNTIRGNSIFDNGRLNPFSTSFPGIDLGNSWGVTPNDPLDTDAGPNNLQNYPLITSASALIGKTKIEGTLNSTPSKTFTLDFYSNAQADPSGYGEGEIYLGAATVATDLNGDVSFSVTVPVAVASGRFITATATDAEGNTSEFSGQSPPVVQDTTPPVISAVSASPAVLWPPNHKLVLVTIDYTATDDSGVASCTLSATSNEPDNGLGDGDTANDIQPIPGDAHHLWLRAERAGNGNGRIYTVTITCTDASGNASSKAVTVTVPKS